MSNEPVKDGEGEKGRRPSSLAELKKILADHVEWLASEKDSERRGRKADFDEANLSLLPLFNANLSGAKLYKANLFRAKLLEANLSRADLQYANLTSADLSGADLSGAKLGSANLSGAKLGSANLSGADLRSADLSGTSLMWADLSGADLQSANLSGAVLRHANLSGAKLSLADLSGTHIQGAELSGAKLSLTNLSGAGTQGADLSGADLRDVRSLRLNNCRTAGAQFTPVVSRWRAWATRLVWPRLRRLFEARDWERLARWANRNVVENDPWSVLRQLYAGPQTLFLFFFVIVFALPYVGRAAFYSTVSAAEQRVIDAWQQRKEQWRDAARAVAGPVADHHDPFDDVEQWVRRKVTPRPLWQLLLRWDEGKVWPTVLAVVLILYNVGVYWLITAVGPLRDEEERSGWSPAWKDYGYLRWVHRGVTVLFYVSFLSFLVTTYQLLTEVVWVPAG